MNIYSIHAIPGAKDSKPITIKQGFSFIAGIFNLFWALYHRMWLVFLVTVIANMVAGMRHNIEFVSYAVNISILFLFGFFASELREFYAKKRGYKLADIVIAGSEEEAEVKYIMRTGEEKL